MASVQSLECSQSLNALIEAFYRYRDESGMSEKKALAKFMGELGYQKSGPKRKMDFKLNLTTGLRRKILDEEERLTCIYLTQEDNPKKARSVAQYIIVESLLTFDCRAENGKRMHEKNVCEFLGYCPRTIENYRKIHREYLINDKDSVEYAESKKLRKELEIIAK